MFNMELQHLKKKSDPNYTVLVVRRLERVRGHAPALGLPEVFIPLKVGPEVSP